MRKVPVRKDAHPLYRCYHRMRHAARIDPHGVDERWLDFWTFTQDVGERPDNQVLLRLDRSKPFGPNNWAWETKMTRMVKNLGGAAVLVLNQRNDVLRRKVAGMNCQRSKALFSQIKRTVTR